MQDIKWCTKISDGIKIIEPNINISNSFLEQARKSLAGAYVDFIEEDLIWATVKLYYAEYYSVYSFLQRIGIKCENHSCSILLAKTLLESTKNKNDDSRNIPITDLDTINEHRKNRIDSQYYLKTGKKEEIEKMLRIAKIIYSEFDLFLLNISEKDITIYRKKFAELINN
jgi:uncharacterized protein (UPF0332 family)